MLKNTFKRKLFEKYHFHINSKLKVDLGLDLLIAVKQKTQLINFIYLETIGNKEINSWFSKFKYIKTVKIE